MMDLSKLSVPTHDPFILTRSPTIGAGQIPIVTGASGLEPVGLHTQPNEVPSRQRCSQTKIKKQMVHFVSEAAGLPDRLRRNERYTPKKVIEKVTDASDVTIYPLKYFP